MCISLLQLVRIESRLFYPRSYMQCACSPVGALVVVVVMTVVGVTLVVLVTVVVPVGVVVVVVVTSSKQAKICRSWMTKMTASSAGVSGTIFKTLAKTLLGKVASSLPGVVDLKVCREKFQNKSKWSC